MPLKKLREIASGGEISRVMLSIKACLQDKQTSHIMVFDEIDTGIGGTTAIHVGRKMLELSKFRQLIVITHLPQIAKYADHHLQVNKTSTVESSDTLTTILELDVEERLKEIARMLSGKVSPTELEFAKKFIAEK